MKQKIMIWAVMLVSMPLVARYHSVNSDKEFEKLVNQYPYAVVCFAPSSPLSKGQDRDEKDDTKRDYKEIVRTLKAASNREAYHRYLNKDVGFLVVDVAAKKAHEVSQEYALSQFPICTVFQSGAVEKQFSSLRPTSSHDVLRLLEKSHGKALKERLKDRKDDERLKREERIANAYWYGNSLYGWGYPGYGYGWGYPGYGYGGYGYRGCGWGGGCYPGWRAGIWF
jgi:hypothetical protein